MFPKRQWADLGSGAVSGLVSLESGLGDTAAVCSLDTGLRPPGKTWPCSAGELGCGPHSVPLPGAITIVSAVCYLNCFRYSWGPY